jgi:hypothetical protein
MQSIFGLLRRRVWKKDSVMTIGDIELTFLVGSLGCDPGSGER